MGGGGEGVERWGNIAVRKNLQCTKTSQKCESAFFLGSPIKIIYMGKQFAPDFAQIFAQNSAHSPNMRHIVTFLNMRKLRETPPYCCRRRIRSGAPTARHQPDGEDGAAADGAVPAGPGEPGPHPHHLQVRHPTGRRPLPPRSGGGGSSVTTWQDGRAPPRTAQHQVQIPAHVRFMASFCAPPGEGGG